MFKKIGVEKIEALVKIFPNCIYIKNKPSFTLFLTKLLPFTEKICSYSSDTVLIRRSFCKLHLRRDDNVVGSIRLKSFDLYIYRK